MAYNKRAVRDLVLFLLFQNLFIFNYTYSAGQKISMRKESCLTEGIVRKYCSTG